MLNKILVVGFDNDTSVDIIHHLRDNKVYAELYYDQTLDDDVLGLVVHPDNKDIVKDWRVPKLIDSSENINDETLNLFIKENSIEKNWSIKNYLELLRTEIMMEVKDNHVLLALSGGVDSSVVATLLREIIGDQLHCMFVDHGFMRKNEPEEIKEEFMGRQNINLLMIDARDRFYNKLKGVSDPEEKRKIIGNEFIQTFIDNIGKNQSFKYLAQGTIYPDVIESMKRDGQFTKSHHNVGGLPGKLGFDLLEPMKMLFKSEVRELGQLLGLKDELVFRQPFPGPGIAIRIIGEITKEKIIIVQESDYILREEIKNAYLDRDIWQYFTVLTNIRSVGKHLGERTYDYTIGIRAVNTNDGVTALSAVIPFELLHKISNRITNEVKGVNRVVYDITNKPPATIEWE